MAPLRRALAPLLVLLLAVALTACGGGDSVGGASAGSDSTGGNSVGSDSAGSDASSGGPTVGSAEAPVTEATVVSPSTSFDVTTIYVPAGVPVTITYDNQHAGVPHNFHVTGDGVDEMTAIVPGPNTSTLTVTFPTAGEYPYVCDVHSSMTGTVIAV